MYENDYNGSTAFRSRKIRLNPKAPDTQLPCTLLHEALHALGEAYEIAYWRDHINAEAYNKDGDKIDLMARTLLLFMRSNPKIINWLVNNA